MALTDESSGIPATMLVGPTGVGNSGFGGFGNGGDGWWIILLILLFAGGFNNGYGGYGGNGGVLYPWMNQANLTSNGFQNQMLNDNVTSIRDGIAGLSTQMCSGFGDVATQLCNGFNGTQMAIANGFAGVEQGANARQIANMQQAFAAQTAVTAGMNNLAMGLQNCCCENRAATADLKYTVATEACADRAAVNDALRNVIEANTASTQRILDQMCQDKIDAKNDTIAQLRQELLYARGQASQDVQTQRILTDNLAQTNALEQYLAPVPRPAYVVQNPNCCAQNYCGCNM